MDSSDTRRATKLYLAELYVAFTYLGIPSVLSLSLPAPADINYSAQLLDFELGDDVEPLLQWILRYFSGTDPQRNAGTVSEVLRGARPVIVSERLPIILQHKGHSRTIVGCEQGKGGVVSLLTFDPAK